MESIIKQGAATQKIKELIICDDAGGDKTLEIAQNYLSKNDVSFRLYKTKKNIGEYRICNEVIFSLPDDMDWVVILHGDNIAKPGWLETIFNRLETASDTLATVSSSWDNISFDGKLTSPSGEKKTSYEEYFGKEHIAPTIRSGCWWHISASATRISAFKKVGGLPVNGMMHKGDLYLLLKFFAAGFSVGYEPKSLMLYRENPSGSSSRSFRSANDIAESGIILTEFGRYLSAPDLIEEFNKLLIGSIRRMVAGLLRGNFLLILSAALVFFETLMRMFTTLGKRLFLS